MSIVNIKLYEFARKEMNLSEDKAMQFIQAIDEVVKEDIKGEGLNELATKSFVKDEIHRLELSTYKAVFWAGLIQFLAIVAAIFGIINFMLHR
jgi:hypothetical protein